LNFVTTNSVNPTVIWLDDAEMDEKEMEVLEVRDDLENVTELEKETLHHIDDGEMVKERARDGA